MAPPHLPPSLRATFPDEHDRTADDLGRMALVSYNIHRTPCGASSLATHESAHEREKGKMTPPPPNS